VTASFDLPGRIDPEAVTERLRYLQRTQDELTEQANAAQVGRVLEILIDQVEDGVPVGRTYREAPDIDGMVTLDRGRPGEWVSAKIVASYGVDLAAEVGEA
jgi:ribosomal protein S12 methylthiotransferase